MNYFFVLFCEKAVRPQRVGPLPICPLAISFCVVKKLPLLSSFYLLRHKLKCKALRDCQTASGSYLMPMLMRMLMVIGQI